MPTSVITLVGLPKFLRKGIKRRLPHGHRFKNMTGNEYAHRTVIGFAGFRGRFAVWLCRCKCGRLSIVEGALLGNPKRQSCGCVLQLSPAAKKVEHVLNSIKSLCHSPSHEAYSHYGGKGITVCKRWRESTEAFAEDMGPRPSPKHVLVRRNKRGNYTPSNCFWGTRADVVRGRARGGLREITCNGTTKNLTQWASELGISREAMRQRVNRCLKLDLDPSLAVTHPIRRWLPKKAAS